MNSSKRDIGRDHPLNDPEVESAIRGTLVRRGFKQQDLEDGLQRVKLEVLEAIQKGNLEDETKPRVQAVACGTASHIAIREGTKEKAQREREEKQHHPLQANAAPSERKGADALDAAIDHKRMLDVLAEMKGPRGIDPGVLDAIERVDDGEKLTKVAAEQETPRDVLKGKMETARSRAQKRWARLGFALVTILAAGVGVDRYKESLKVDHDGTDAMTATGATPIVHYESAAEHARKAAMAKCAAQDWEGCLKGLNDAIPLDLDHDWTPEELVARNAATTGLDTNEANAKPRSAPRPPPMAPKK